MPSASTPSPQGSVTPPAPRSQGPVATSGVRLWREGHLPRTIGGGLLAFYLLDVSFIASGYELFKPAADYSLSSQIIERSAVALIAFAFLFWPGGPPPRRGNRLILKALSWSALVFAIIYTSLVALVISAGLRLYQRAATAITIQRTTQSAIYERVAAEASTLSLNQLRVIYFEFVPDAKLTGNTPGPDAISADVRSRALKRVDETRETADRTLQRLRREQVTSTAKFTLEGIVAAAMFFLVWDLTAAFRPRAFEKDAPNLRFESKVAGQFQRIQRWGEAAFAPPDLEKFRWYRRLRRKFRRKP